MIQSIVVFCGSSAGHKPIYRKMAYDLGSELALRQIEVVYGGNNVGLMGAVADGALDHNGKVTGVLPRFLESKEAAHLGLSKLIMVDTMHERKLIMHQLSDAVITLPGGFGTMEEFFEMLTWHQLGLHNKPVSILNVNGYYDSLISLVAQMNNEGLLSKENQQKLIVSDSIDDLLNKIQNYHSSKMEKLMTDRSV
jgi:uncharacterized protein (TIGR00730 family)